MRAFIRMGLRNPKLWQNSFPILEEMFNWTRVYSTKSNPVVDLRKLRPMILKRIEERAKEYPVKGMLPVAREVLEARTNLYDGVSILTQHIPIWACNGGTIWDLGCEGGCDTSTSTVGFRSKLILSSSSILRWKLSVTQHGHLKETNLVSSGYCPEVYIGEGGHLIRTCHGYQHHAKNKVHNWVKGSTDDVIVPVETFHLQKMFQNVVKHDERFDYDRVPAIVELCLQAGVDPNDGNVSPSVIAPDDSDKNNTVPWSLSDDDLRLVATRTMKAWETLRSGVRKLLLVYPARVCKHCSEVHVGPSGHKARMCGVFKYESWRGTHFWKKARVDDLVPPKIVWYRRRQDPPILVDEGRNYYGHAPAVVDLCSKTGALVPSKYFCMMKMDGLTAPA